MTRIAVDAMGGDRAPGPEVAGAVAAVRASDDVDVVLVGDAAQIESELARLGAEPDERLQIRHASQVVTMDDHPGRAFRTKPDSSMRVAFDLVAAGEADAVVSAGHSGAMLGHGLFVLRRLPGVDRPAIATSFPTPTGTVVLCDMGANVEVKPRMLAQFGVLGACYARVVHGCEQPRVGLLSNGTEPGKGTELTRAADALLRAAADTPDAGFTYAGYIEGTALFSGDVDVVATDGFTGNVALKLAEGLAASIFDLIAREMKDSTRARIALPLIRPAFSRVKAQIDYAETGGALLVGVGGLVAICHGRSDDAAIRNAIGMVARFADSGLLSRLAETIARQRSLWRAEPQSASTDGEP